MLRKINIFRGQAGQSLLEVVMVAFILVMALVALISLTTVSIARNRLAKERTVATRLAQEGLEWFKFERDRLGYDAVFLKDDKSYCLSEFPAGGIELLPEGVCGAEDWVNVPSLGRLYQRTISLSSPVDPSEIKAVVVVRWRGKEIEQEGSIKKWGR